MLKFAKRIDMELADLDLSKTYTYADYFKWTFDERVELIKGKIFRMSPAPNRIRQEITGTIYRKIGNFLERNPCCVYVAPFDVRLTRKSKDDQSITTVLQPDVCVICDPSILDDRGCVGAPDIVVETLSPGNSKKEVKNKFEVYEEAGVKEYWIVDPIRQTLQVNRLQDGRYVILPALTTEDKITTSILPGFSLDLAQLFDKF